MAHSDTSVDFAARTIRREHRQGGDTLEIAAAKQMVAAALFSSTEEAHKLPTVGRYELRRRLGAGGMGIVFAAYDPSLKRDLAVKLLHPRTSLASAEELLLEEARHTAKLLHPAVVTIFDAGRHEGRIFIAMELIEGCAMSEWLRSRPPWRHIVAVLAVAARGLEAAHKRHIIHRDFKPANVLIGWDGRVCVADFGLARAMRGEAAQSGGGADAMHVLTRGDAAGTPAYMAPEQYLGTTLDERSDQFSFCVSLYEALTGRKPFTGTTLAQLRDAILTSEPPKPGGHDTPDVLVRAVSRGLSKNRHDRFASMGELAALLESLAGDVDLSHVCREQARRSGLFQAPVYEQYVRELQQGLATDPDARVPNRITRVALALRPLEFPPSALVPIIADLRRYHVIPPVHARAILCALYDEHFCAIEPWTEFMRRVSRSLMQLAFVGFAVSSVAAPQYIHSVVATYNNLVKGTPVLVVDEPNAEPQTAIVAFEHPSEAMNDVIRVVLAECLRGVMLASGCRSVTATFRERAEDTFQVELSWHE